MLEKRLETLDKKLKYYLSLPYTIEVIREVDEEGEESWFARVAELPGCMTEADDFAELGEMIQDAMISWIETALEDGQPIPEPRPVEGYSGKFVIRVPKSLHRELAETAERDGVSLNTFVNTALGRTLGTSQRFVVSETDSANLPEPIWPHLSDSAWRAMIAAGLKVEAQTITEQMFADWLENNVQQVEAALEIGSVADTRWHMAECSQALRICSASSPIMRAFYQVFNLLQNQVEQNAQLLAGTIPQPALRAKIKMQIQASSSSQVQEKMQRYSIDLSPETTVAQYYQPFSQGVKDND